MVRYGRWTGPGRLTTLLLLLRQASNPEVANVAGRVAAASLAFGGANQLKPPGPPPPARRLSPTVASTPPEEDIPAEEPEAQETPVDARPAPRGPPLKPVKGLVPQGLQEQKVLGIFLFFLSSYQSRD